MANILLLYSTIDGHAYKIGQKIQAEVEQSGHHVQLISMDDVHSVSFDKVDKIVIGASIRYGKHHPKVFDFVKRHQPLLDDKPSAFFSVNVVARKPHKNTPETNPYVKKFFKHVSWRPQVVAVFAGKIDYPKYGVLDRWMIRLIMAMTKGPTDIHGVFEFTDWDAVTRFAKELDSL